MNKVGGGGGGGGGGLCKPVLEVVLVELCMQ